MLYPDAALALVTEISYRVGRCALANPAEQGDLVLLHGELLEGSRRLLTAAQKLEECLEGQGFDWRAHNDLRDNHLEDLKLDVEDARRELRAEQDRRRTAELALNTVRERVAA